MTSFWNLFEQAEQVVDFKRQNLRRIYKIWIFKNLNFETVNYGRTYHHKRVSKRLCLPKIMININFFHRDFFLKSWRGFNSFAPIFKVELKIISRIFVR